LYNWGWTEVQSAAVHIPASYPAEGILPSISSYHQLLIINLASVPGRQLVNSPTAQSLKRWLQAGSSHSWTRQGQQGGVII